MKTARDWEVPGYFAAVLIAVGVLFAITAMPGNSAELFPNPSAAELVRAVQCVWTGTAESCE